MDAAFNRGDYSKIEAHINSQLDEVDEATRQKWLIQLEIIRRTRLEFPYSGKDVREQLSAWYPNLNDEQIDRWEKLEQLEMRVIDGEKRYFKRAVSNFFRLNDEAKKITMLCYKPYGPFCSGSVFDSYPGNRTRSSSRVYKPVAN